MDNLRTVEVLKNGKWEQGCFQILTEGDVFRLFEDGSLVEDKGCNKFEAASNPYQCEMTGVWTINVNNID